MCTRTTFTPEVCGSQDLSLLRPQILTKDMQPRLQCDTEMICQGNFNWQGRVRIKVKDIGFGLVSG